ncbi:MAG: hypothetical protein JW913_19885 [Chitinispirillaceae bacterium]|nr:hypothetical protein [Chitinispirillaceae bacterium]
MTVFRNTRSLHLRLCAGLFLICGMVSLASAQSNGILRQYWSGISGVTISNLTSNGNYPNSPTSSSTVSSFEGPTQAGDNYGCRYRGFIVPPTTGTYTFWIASDDYSELWLSTSSDPANASRIAYVNGYCDSRQWTKYSSQESSGITLQAGQYYYIEALHKEGSQNDNLAVGWRGPGITGDAERPIPNSRLRLWTGNQYTLTVNNNGHGTTSPSGAVTVTAGVARSVSATAASGYQFSNWTVTSGTATIANANSASTTVTLWSANATVRANFTAVNYTLTVTNDGNGTTNPSGTVTVTHGVAQSISATAASGYQFSSWTVTSGTATIVDPSSASTTVTLTGGNATIRANFAVSTYNLTVTNDGHGTTTPSGTVVVTPGVARSISATAASGYEFSNWTVTSGTATIADPASAATTVTLTSGNATIRANFTGLTYSLTMTNDGNGTTVPSGTVTVTHGVAQSISATAATGYVFSNWTVTGGTATIASPTSASTTVTLTSGDATIRANFTLASYTLTVTNDGHGTTTPSGAVSVTHGVAQSISATAATGYTFLNWTVTGGAAAIASPNSASTTVTLTSGDATIQANFTTVTYDLTVTNDGNGTTTPSGSVSVPQGVAQPISAIAASGYVFANWTVTSGTAAIASPNAAATTVTLNAGDATIQANFTVAPPVQPNNRRLAITGTLSDAEGSPVGSPDPVTIAVEINITPTVDGGTPLYTETFLPQNGQGVVVDNGHFVVTLGTGFFSTDLAAVLAANENCFAEITILGEMPDVLLPRTPITAAAYALGVSAATGSTELHGNGYPVDPNVEGKIGTYYVNDNDGTTWLRVQSGWKQID